MKFRATAYVFHPDTTPPTIDFSGDPRVTATTIEAVFNRTNPGTVYGPIDGYGGTWLGRSLMLEASTADMLTSDSLIVVADDGKPGALDETVSGGLVQAHGDAQALLTKLGTLGSQTTLAAAADTLTNIRAALLAQIDFEETVWTDGTAYYARRVTENEGTGGYVVVWTDTAGTVISPPTGVEPAARTQYKTIETAYFDATASGTGYASGDVLARVLVFDTRTNTIAASFWHNMTSAAAIAAPAPANIAEQSRNIAVTSSVLPNGAATSAKQDTTNTSLGAPGDTAATSDSGSFSLLAFVKRALGYWTTLLARTPVLGQAVAAASVPVVVASNQSAVPVSAAALPLPAGAATDATLAQQQPFQPITGGTIGLSVGPSATSAPVALPTNTATSYRVRNAASSASPVTWVMATTNTRTPVIPTPYSTAGTGGTAGDKTIDPGAVEIFQLNAAQQTSLAAGTLYLSAICPTGGSATLYITPGTGA